MMWRFGFPGPDVGVWWIVGLVVMVLFWALLIGLVVLGIRWLIRADRNSRLGAGGPGGGTSGWGAAAPRPDDPLEILRQRYARGEIDEEEYERRRKTLTAP
jgi:putative membrane protein